MCVRLQEAAQEVLTRLRKGAVVLGLPQEFNALVETCLLADPASRPTSLAVANTLRALRQLPAAADTECLKATCC